MNINNIYIYDVEDLSREKEKERKCKKESNEELTDCILQKLLNSCCKISMFYWNCSEKIMFV